MYKNERSIVCGTEKQRINNTTTEKAKSEKKNRPIEWDGRLRWERNVCACCTDDENKEILGYIEAMM